MLFLFKTAQSYFLDVCGTECQSFFTVLCIRPYTWPSSNSLKGLMALKLFRISMCLWIAIQENGHQRELFLRWGRRARSDGAEEPEAQPKTESSGRSAWDSQLGLQPTPAGRLLSAQLDNVAYLLLLLPLGHNLGDSSPSPSRILWMENFSLPLQRGFPQSASAGRDVPLFPV